MIPGTGPKPAVPLMAAQPKKPGHMLVLGTGFVGRYVSERLLTQGCFGNLHALQDATHLLISIPPIPGVGAPLLASHADLQRTLTDSNLQWLCYLSSTGVYGDCGGAWVDEDHVVNPKSESSKLRYAAEEGWLDLVDDLDLSAFVLRLGGIYGPGRSALDTIAKSKSLSRRQKMRESKQYTARIHVADIYQAILASMSIRSARFLFSHANIITYFSAISSLHALYLHRPTV